MTPIEKSKLIDKLFSLRKADQELMESERKRMEYDRKRLDDLLDSFQAVNVELRALRVQLFELLKQLAAKDAENASLREELKLSRKNLYGKKSQRGCSSKKKESVSREEFKDDFDGTSGSLPCCGEEPSPSGEVAPASAASPKEARLYRLGMDYHRIALTNWPVKGSVFVNKLVDVLKEKCLDKDAVLNCDETWYRVKLEDTYRKRYICNVAHARAKFKYPLEQSDDKDAGYILGCVGELYGLEREYEQGKLSSEQIRGCRQGLNTKEIIGRLHSKLDAMLSGEYPPRGELMEKPLRYLHTFWKQLFVYLNDGRYSIDNSLAERFIRPLAGERNSAATGWRKSLLRIIRLYPLAGCMVYLRLSS